MLLYLKLFCAFSCLIYIIECQDTYSYRNDRWKSDRFYASNDDATTEFIATRVRGKKDRRSDLLIWRDGASTVLSTVKDTGVFQRYSMEVPTPIFCPFTARVEGAARLRLYSGDINGDQRDDLICHDETTGEVTVRLLSYTYHPETPLDDTEVDFTCMGQDSLRIGDFDGNGSDDLLCLDSITYTSVGTTATLDTAAGIYFTKGCYSRYHDRGKREIYLEAAFVQEGHPRNCPSHLPAVVAAVDSDDSDGSLCKLQEVSDDVIVHIGDVNGDGKSDVICQDRREWELYYRLSQGITQVGNNAKSVLGSLQNIVRPPPDNWSGIYGLPFCYLANAEADPLGSVASTQTPSRIMKVADVNGDGKIDLLCLRDGTGSVTEGIQILFAPFTENVDQPNTPESGFCLAGISRGDYYQIGDFNGDGKDDVLCRKGVTGSDAITEIVASEKDFSTDD